MIFHCISYYFTMYNYVVLGTSGHLPAFQFWRKQDKGHIAFRSSRFFHPGLNLPCCFHCLPFPPGHSQPEWLVAQGSWLNLQSWCLPYGWPRHAPCVARSGSVSKILKHLSWKCVMLKCSATFEPCGTCVNHGMRHLVIPLGAPSIQHRLEVGGIHGKPAGTSKMPPKSIRSHHASLVQWLSAVRSPWDT